MERRPADEERHDHSNCNQRKTAALQGTFRQTARDALAPTALTDTTGAQHYGCCNRKYGRTVPAGKLVTVFGRLHINLKLKCPRSRALIEQLMVHELTVFYGTKIQSSPPHVTFWDGRNQFTSIVFL
jgi:hypothetical protein